MTHEEAIEWLDKAKGNAEALRMAKEALEKQIPKKPVWDDTYFLCPTCGKKIHYSDYRNVPVCRECYQILDWSEA